MIIDEKIENKKRSGVLFLALIGFLIAALIGIFLFFFEESMGAIVLFLLGIFAVIGIFTVFASTIGLIKIGGVGKTESSPYAFLEALEDAHLVTGSDGQILYADKEYRDLTGTEYHMDVPSIERAFAMEENVSETVFRLSLAVNEGRFGSEEVRLERPLASSVTDLKDARDASWYQLSVRPVLFNANIDDGKKLNLWRVRDITKDRENQEFAFQELQNVINYLDHAPAGFFSSEPDGKIVYINATLAYWLGYDLTEFEVGRVHVHDIIRGDGAALLNTVPAKSGETRTEIIDLDFVKRNGQSLPVRLLHLTPFKKDGAPGATRTIVINRLESGDAEEENLEGAAQFSRFFNSAPVAITSLDSKGLMVRANASFLSLFKTGKCESGKQALVDLVSENEREKLGDAIKAAQEGQGEIDPVDVALKGEDESSARLFISSVIGRVDASLDEGVIIYAIDITRQRALEQQFAQGQKMQAIGQLAGGIAHDFNNMLTAIIGFSDLLLQNHGPADPSFQDIMNIKNNANRAAGLVRQLLAFSRRQTLRPKVIDLRDIVEDLSILLERLLGENVRLHVTHGRDLWPVKADLNQLEQVIINLSVNARDAMKQGGDLTISTENITKDACDNSVMEELVPADYVLIKVADTGTGMTPEVMAKIFEPFFSTKGVGEGTGLGLATVYGIIKQSDGYIYPVSRVGEGTVFHIFLPRHEIVESEEEQTNQPIEKPRDLSGSANILLVEDEEAVRAFSARALQARGHTVHEASSGAHALEVMEEVGGEIDLVVSDVVMPEMDGPTLLGELRKVRPELKIIFVSGYAEDAFEKHLVEGQKFEFLAKPFSLKQLATKVKEVLDND